MTSTRRATVVVGLAGGLLCGSFGIGGGAVAGPHVAAATGHISAVRFTGTVKKPTITITGSGFGSKPTPNLPISPDKAGRHYHAACATQRVAGNGKDGHDYKASDLGMNWGAQRPHGYKAGVYVRGSYIDCIGLIIVKYTNTKVVLRPGCQYALYRRMKEGDAALISVNGGKKRLSVHYQS
jgi:hypothetical protein